MLTLSYDLLLLGLLILFTLGDQQRPELCSPHPTTPTPSGPRPLKPRSPDDCPACRAPDQSSAIPIPSPTPWSQVKSRRGRPKLIPTQGFACPNQACAYYAITDAAIHALVGDGRHGKAEPIQTFRCQACQITFNARRDTPLYRLKTPGSRVAQALSALAEGLDVAATARVFGHREATISIWLSRGGLHMQRLHARRLQGLHLPHVQLDES